jgi:hypothetical protein
MGTPKGAEQPVPAPFLCPRSSQLIGAFSFSMEKPSPTGVNLRNFLSCAFWCRRRPASRLTLGFDVLPSRDQSKMGTNCEKMARSAKADGRMRRCLSLSSVRMPATSRPHQVIPLLPSSSRLRATFVSFFSFCAFSLVSRPSEITLVAHRTDVVNALRLTTCSSGATEAGSSNG